MDAWLSGLGKAIEILLTPGMSKKRFLGELVRVWCVW